MESQFLVYTDHPITKVKHKQIRKSETNLIMANIPMATKPKIHPVWANALGIVKAPAPTIKLNV